jgi:hypothetical protein
MPKQDASITTPEAAPTAEPAPVLVYNRTPTRIAGVYKFLDSKTGKFIELPPGGSALVPAHVADAWCRVSNGHVTKSADPSQVTDAQALLAIERARTNSLEAKILEMEARHAELERKLRGN